MKKRILFVSEASYIHSGFGKFYRELLTGLHKTGKYEIAELASYGTVNNPKDSIIKWRYYANAVRGDDPRHATYKSNPLNEFGFWRFDRVLADFKPDIVFDMRDSFMFTFEATSAFREFYHWCISPTVDSAPQKLEWIDMFRNADSVFVYSDWATPVLEKEGSGKINLVGELSPGVDLDIFAPVANKEQHREAHGLTNDLFIIGTVMRNQIRKLYPDLFYSFKKLLQTLPSHTAEKTYLLCHTSYPDNGWNIPDLLLENEIANKVLFTYVCSKCKHWEVSLYKDSRAACCKCHSDTMLLPNTGHGVDDKNLAKIFNLMDFYVQYANCEGFGMPAVEAAACGIPVAEVDYSAMSDIVRKLGGWPIPVKVMRREMNDYAYRAIPDNDAFVEIMRKYIDLPNGIKAKNGFKARKNAEKHYRWEDKVRILERHFDSIELTGKQGKWDSAPPNIVDIPPPPAAGMSNAEFVEWCFTSILAEPISDKNAQMYSFYLSALNRGFTESGKTNIPVNREYVANQLTKIRNNKNHAEKVRVGMLQAGQEDYIEYANIKQGVA